MREDWTKLKLGEVISLEYGKPLPKDKRCEESEFPAYGANGIKCYAVEPYWENPSIIVGRKGTAGAVKLVEGGFWPLDVTYFVTFDDGEYDRKFLYFLLSSLNLPSLATGVKPGINRNVVYAIERSFPSVLEQKRIVALLDEAFAGIDAVFANTEKNLANARELYTSSLGKIFGVDNVREWKKEELKDVVAESCSLSYGIVQPGKEVQGGLPIVRPTDLTDSLVRLKGLKLIDPSKAASYTRTTLEGGELLLCVRGSTGAVSFASDELAGGNVTRGIVPVRFDHEVVSQSFGYYLLVSPLVQEQVKEKTYGAALMQINIRDLRKLKLAFPKMDDQKGLVKKLNDVSAEVERLEAIYQQKLTALAELKQSLLQKAFSGELTASKAEAAVEEATA